jgi:hypothetical protein
MTDGRATNRSRAAKTRKDILPRGVVFSIVVRTTTSSSITKWISRLFFTMADISIINHDSRIEPVYFSTAHKMNVGQVLNSIGDGVLTKVEDGVIYANHNVELVAGTYTWKERPGNQKQGTQQQPGTDKGRAKVVAGQYPGGKLPCCFCILVFNCGFEYENVSAQILFVEFLVSFCGGFEFGNAS